MADIILPGLVADESLRRWITNQGEWRATIEDGEPVLSLPDNRTRDWRHGAVALAGSGAWRDYEWSLEMLVLPPPDPDAGAWPGVVFNAQDAENYDLVWLMPSPGGENVVYLPVAHGLVPWWADAYVNNPRGSAPYNRGEWLPVSVRVQGMEASVRVRNQEGPVLTVRLTYYLDGGRVGVYCGTGTSAKFRRFDVRPLPPMPVPEPPQTARPRVGGSGD